VCENDSHIIVSYIRKQSLWSVSGSLVKAMYSYPDLQVFISVVTRVSHHEGHIADLVALWKNHPLYTWSCLLMGVRRC